MLMQTASQREPDDNFLQVILALTPAHQHTIPDPETFMTAFMTQSAWPFGRPESISARLWRTTSCNAARSVEARAGPLRVWAHSCGLSGGSPSVR